MSKIKNLKNFIETATGKKTADVSIYGNIFNVYTGKTSKGHIMIKDGGIACVTDEKPKAKKYYSFNNKYILPGFIDSHIHIESTMLTPSVFSKIAIRHGTTAVLSDPHEITNVFGEKGIKFMIKDSRKTPLNFYFMIPSCVPSSKFETTGGKIEADDVKKLHRKFPEIKGLAEFMDFPSLVSAEKETLSKIVEAESMTIDGHAPSLTGKKLCGYISAGIKSDHECTKAEEALEKLEKGMYVMAREGSTAKNLKEIAKIINEKNERRFTLVTDDINVKDLLDKGHIDKILRKAVRNGLTPCQAIRMVTLNPAEYLNIENIGAIAPGKKADLAVVNNLKDFKVSHTFIKGKLIAENGKIETEIKPSSSKTLKNSVRNRKVSKESLKIKIKDGDEVKVIKAFDHSLYTDYFEYKVETNENKEIKTDGSEDILKICVIERHKRTGNIGKGLVNGFGLKNGALASTIAHDSHNIICIGTNDADMAKAISHLKKIDGGIVFAKNKKIVEQLSLPVAGLMTDKNPEKTSKKLDKLRKKLSLNGCKLESPIATLSFMALPVIPRLKIADQGLINVEKHEKTDLIVK